MRGFSELVLLTRGSDLESSIESSPYEVEKPTTRVADDAWWLPTLQLRSDRPGS